MDKTDEMTKYLRVVSVYPTAVGEMMHARTVDNPVYARELMILTEKYRRRKWRTKTCQSRPPPEPRQTDQTERTAKLIKLLFSDPI